MRWGTINKSASDFRVPPKLQAYLQRRSEYFSEAAPRELSGLPDSCGLNFAHEALDRCIHDVGGQHLALGWLRRRNEVGNYTYENLRGLTNRFSNVPRGLGIRQSDRVLAIAGSVPELYVSSSGTLKGGGVFCPILSAFGPETIRQRRRAWYPATDLARQDANRSCRFADRRDDAPESSGHLIARFEFQSALMKHVRL